MRPAEGPSLADGRYVFERHLGSGGMATVWLARDEALARPVAIKLMADTLADDDRWLERFKREARAAAALSHPHIVKVFDFGIEEHRPYLVMAHISGGSLRDRLRDGGALPGPAGLARELLGALGHVHAAGIVHRDVKPGNILLDEHDRSHLTDFGIARPQDATAMTQTGMVLGTMRYLAPEVAEGEPATERSDLYAAGAVLRELDAEETLAALVGALTEKDPGRRPASAEDALAMLDADAPTERLAPAPTTREPALQRLDDVIRKPWFPAAAGILAILALAVIVIALAGGGESPREPSAAPASAPLGEQLRGLDRAIDAAASRGR